MSSDTCIVDAGEVIALFRCSTRSPELRALLTRLGVAAVGSARGACRNDVMLRDCGLRLGFRAEELGVTDLFRLVSARFSRGSFVGALPYGLSFDDTLATLRVKLGEPLNVFGPDSPWWPLHDRHHHLSVDLDRRGRVESVSAWIPPPKLGQEPPRLAWSLLGFSPADAPMRLGLRVAAASVVADTGGGVVEVATSFAHDAQGRLVPVRGGCFDERVFGQLPRHDDGRLDFDDDARWPGERLGCIALPVPVIHPWVSRYGLRLLAAITGWKGRRLRDLLAMECGVTRDNDDPWRAVPPYEDGAFGPRVFWGAAALMQLAADERSVLPSGAILDRLPVLPVAHRRPRRTSAGGLESDEATILYEELLQRIADWRIVRERGEPIQVWMTTRAVQRAVEALLLGRFAEPVADDEEDVDEDEDEEVAEEADDKDAEEADDEDAEEADDEDAEEADDEDAELDEDGVGESEAGEDGVDESEAGEEASHGGGDHPEDDEAEGEEDLPALLDWLRHPDSPGKDWLRRLDRDIAEKPSLAWETCHTAVRVHLDAAALELVPLDPAGQIDAVATLRMRRTRLAERIARGYGNIVPLASNWRPEDPRDVTVFDTAPRSDGTCLLLTAGASEQVPFEIAMCVSSSMPRPERETLALCLMRLARRAQRETWGLDSPREVRLEGLPPPLAGVVLLVPEGEAWTSLTSRLPRSPELLVAVGVMESVLQRGAHAIEPELREGGYRTDPRTASGAER